jgi:hypothetical protein
MKAIWVSVAMALLVCMPSSAQTNATISGYAKDPTGAFVPGVRVSVADERTNLKRETITDQNGFYQILGLVSGVYTIEAEAPGFRRFRTADVTVVVDQNVRADIPLEVGDVRQTVEVTAVATQIDTRASERSAVIDDRRVVDLPLSNRNVYALAKTLPGVLNVTAPDNTRMTSTRSGPRMNVNGGRENMNYSRFNGAYFMNPSRNTSLNVPPPDAIQEFKIQTSNFSADTGRNSGANINIVSKQGTNELHGSLWEFARNDNLNARSFFEQTKPQLIKNQYGAAAGGPIRRNKLFVFGAVEFNDDREQPSVTDSRPPSVSELAGDFSHLNGVKQLLNPFDGTPFQGNQIPRSLFDPAAQNILEFTPTVPRPGDTYQALGVRPRDSELLMLRSDANLTDKQTLFGTYYLNQNKDILEGAGAFGGDFSGFANQRADVRVQTVGLNHVYVFSPRMLNQLTLGYTRSFSIYGPTVTRTPESLGIRNLPLYANGGSPSFLLAGRWDLRSGSRDKFNSNTYQIKNDVSLIRGRHTWKFGVEHMDIGWFQSWLAPPSFNFNGSRTGGGVATRGDPMADFLLGAYENVNVNAGVRHNDEGMTFTVFYAQDDFKVTPRLNLNLGVRYELPMPWVEKFDRINTIIPDANVKSTKIPNAPPGMVFPGDTLPNGTRVPRGLVSPDRNNIAPRIGLVWDVFGDGRTALRAAFGVFYDTANGDFLAQTNPPFVVGTRTYRDGLLVDPILSVGEVPMPVTIDPREANFVFPLRGLWGPQRFNLRWPNVKNWSFFVDRSMARDYTVTFGYIGKAGRDLIAFRQWNAAVFIPGTDANGNPLSTRANIEQRAPFLPGIYAPGGQILDDVAISNFHSVQIQLKKRFSKGFQFDTFYVLSKSLDHTSSYTGGTGFTDPNRPDHNYGRSDFDRRHAVTFTGLWMPPMFASSRSLAGRVLGGWTLSAITTLYSGSPLTFSSGEDVALHGAGSARADILGDPKRSHSSRDDMLGEFFNTKAFTRPPTGTVGNSGRGILSGPAQVNTDFALLKDFRVTEQARFQFRAEFFNIFNQVNFSGPRTSLTDARFGQITGAADGRNVLLGLKFLF